jgi:hypothetical protein
MCGALVVCAFICCKQLRQLHRVQLVPVSDNVICSTTCADIIKLFAAYRKQTLQARYARNRKGGCSLGVRITAWPVTLAASHVMMTGSSAVHVKMMTAPSMQSKQASKQAVAADPCTQSWACTVSRTVP